MGVLSKEMVLSTRMDVLKPTCFLNLLDLFPQGRSHICREMFGDLLQAFVCGLLKDQSQCSRSDGWRTT